MAEITLNTQEVFLQLIQGQARIESKLDIYVQRAESLDDKLCKLENEIAQLSGERRFIKFWLPLLICLASCLITFMGRSIKL